MHVRGLHEVEKEKCFISEYALITAYYSNEPSNDVITN